MRPVVVPAARRPATPALDPDARSALLFCGVCTHLLARAVWEGPIGPPDHGHFVRLPWLTMYCPHLNGPALVAFKLYRGDSAPNEPVADNGHGALSFHPVFATEVRAP